MDHPILTIFCPFTRRWAVDRWLKDLSNVEHIPDRTNLCFIIDGDEPYIARTLERFAEERGYRSFHMKQNHNYRTNDSNLWIRRNRIAEIHEQAKDLVAKCDSDYVIGLEDDTVFDRLDSFDKLLRPLIEQADVGFVQGVQMGRWGARMLGVWKADDVNSPKQVETLLPLPDIGVDRQRITGGGWYGYATTKKLFLDAPYFTSPSHPWGADVEFGFWLRQQGYHCLVDWSILFGHDDQGTVMYPDDENANLAKIIFKKREDNGKWEREDHEENRY